MHKLLKHLAENRVIIFASVSIIYRDIYKKHRYLRPEYVLRQRMITRAARCGAGRPAAAPGTRRPAPCDLGLSADTGGSSVGGGAGRADGPQPGPGRRLRRRVVAS